MPSKTWGHLPLGAKRAGEPIPEVARLGRTLKAWKREILAYWHTDRSNAGPTEAICESGFGWSGTGWSGWTLVVPTRV